jgi:hypothetical protein
MNEHAHPSFKAKYAFIQQCKHALSQVDLRLLQDLAHYQLEETEWREPQPNQPQEFANAVRLETLYKSCMPAIYSLAWEEEVNFKTKNPLTAIVAFPELGEDYCSIDQKLVTWV